MADFFQNGLLLKAPTASQCGRTFSRWLYEWLTKVIGMAVVDAQAAAWETYVHQETSPGTGYSVTDEPDLFDIGASTYTFDTVNDAGAYLTLKGLTNPKHDGIYRIIRVVSDKRVQLDVKFSVSDVGLVNDQTAIKWSLWRPTATYCPTSNDVAVVGGTGNSFEEYTFHVHMKVRATQSYFPEFMIAPYDSSWNSTTHTWNDNKHTSAKGIDSWNNSLVNVDNCRVFAAGDKDRVVILLRTEDDYYAWHFVYIGEIDASFPTIDKRPVVLWAGSNRGNSTAAADNNTLVGTGLDSSIGGGGLWLATDEVTSLTGRLMYYHSAVSADSNYFASAHRSWSMFSRQYYLQQLACECLTSGNMEVRGSLRRVWLTARDVQRFLPLGQSGEFAHIVGGFIIPWNQSVIWYER